MEQLREGDMLSLVRYSSAAATPLPLQRLTPGTRALAAAAVDSLHAHGGTALCAGLIEGVRALSAVPPSATALEALFLCTDGEANHGPRGLSDIRHALEALAAAEPGLRLPTVHAFGFGDAHDAALLQGIADWRNGQYAYLARTEDIPSAFADVFGGMLSCVAKDLAVRLAPAGGARLQAVRTGGRLLAAGAGAAAVDGGGQARQTAPAAIAIAPREVAFSDLYAEETREMLVTLALGAAAGQDLDFPLTARLSLAHARQPPLPPLSPSPDHRLPLRRARRLIAAAS
jgi:hypothetical protein